MTRMLWAFFLRDFKRTVSYRFAFALDLLSVFFTAATFFFVARLFNSGSIGALDAYGGDYFPFVLIGIAFASYQKVGLSAFAQNLRQEQFIGTMESILATPVRIPTFLAGSALWDFFYASFEVLFYFILGFALFGLSLPNAAVLPALVSLILTLVTFMGLGILAAGFILKFKRGNPVTWIIATLSELLGGVYFPLNVMPPWLKNLADWVPMTHALEALRKTLINGASFSDIFTHLAFLAGFAVVVWPLGLLVFTLLLQRAQADGTLGHY